MALFCTVICLKNLFCLDKQQISVKINLFVLNCGRSIHNCIKNWQQRAAQCVSEAPSTEVLASHEGSNPRLYGNNIDSVTAIKSRVRTEHVTQIGRYTKY
jgi:hypothetical protein